MINEKDIIRRCQKGDGNAFSEVVTHYQDRIYNTVQQMINNPADALDVCQEAFLKAFQNIGEFQGGSSFSTYLFQIAINECLNYRAKRARAKTGLNEKMVAWAEEVSDPAAEKNQYEYIQQTLDSLEPGLKDIVVLKDMEGLSYAEVAQALNISVSNVRTGLDRARDILRGKLKNLL